MSVTSKTKPWKLDSRFDDSDPTAKTLKQDIMDTLKIKQPTLYGLLPAEKFQREDGYILGIKLSKDVTLPPPTFSACPVVTISREDLEEDTVEVQEISEKEHITVSEPEQTLYELKESGRLANNKIAEKYKTLSSSQSAKKKETFPEWFKSRLWRKFNGSLEKVTCPVCSDSLIEPNSFSAGHILPESKGGMMCLENIMPICGDCNSQMGARHLYWFAWHYYGKVMWQVY